MEEGGKGRGKKGRVGPTPIGDSESGNGGGEGRKKGKEESLGWGVQALIFHFKHGVNY